MNLLAETDINEDREDTLTMREATTRDCSELAELINYAGEGLPLYLWTGMAATGVDPWDIGRERAARETGGFSYRNAMVCEVDGRLAGALIGYPLAENPEPVDPESTPPMFVPVLELENIATDTWYVNAIAAFPEARGLGVGTRLMAHADRMALAGGHRGVSLIVSDANPGARRLYERLGYEAVASRRMVKEQWEHDGEHWILMIKGLR